MHAFMQKPLSRPVNVYVSSNQASLDNFLFISDIIPNLCGDPGAARQLCLRIHLQASLGGRLGRFVIVSMVQGLYKFHQYQVVGRHLPTPNDETPQIYRMKLWATDAVRAKSKFWYFLRKLRKVKKANGQILSVNEITEKYPTKIKNFGIWVRYQSRTGYHNMYKEYRDVTLNGAVEQLYDEMGSRHRVRPPLLNIIKTATVPDSHCKRDNTKQFHQQYDDKINKQVRVKFPMTRKMVRPSERKYKTVFKAVRPNAAMY